MEKVKTIIWGTGFIGSNLVKLMLDKEWVEIVGAIDSSKDMVGNDLGELAGIDKRLGIIVSDDADAVLSSSGANLVAHATPFFPDESDSQIMKALNAGANVITITDGRFAYPWLHWPQLAQRFDEAAKKNGVTICCGGHCPGFCCIFPAFVTGLCGSVSNVLLRMTGDVSAMSPDVLGKGRYGVGLSLDEWRTGGYKKKFVAPGRTQSDISHLLYRLTVIDLVADALGWELDEVQYDNEPVISEKGTRTPVGLEVPAGGVSGWNEVGRGVKDGRTVLRVENWRSVEAAQQGVPENVETLVEGDINIHVAIKGLSIAKCSFTYLMNMFPQVMAAQPGIATLRDLPPITALS